MDGAEDSYAKAWEEVEAAWDDEKAHRRFIALCHGRGALGEAGRRYRAVANADPGRKAAAERWINTILATALEQMALTRTSREAARRPGRAVALLLAAAALALSCWALLRVISR